MNRCVRYSRALGLVFIILLIMTDISAHAAQRQGDNIGVFGVWTPIRFNRGQLDDYIPSNWSLGFFEKEREGLNILMRDSFSTMMVDDLDYNVVPSDTFERLSRKIRDRVYRSYEVEDVNQRFQWDKMDLYCEMLDIRYAMFGDVTKIDVSNPDEIQIEMYVIVYDSHTHSIVYMQQFANNGRMAQAYSHATLSRHHPKMSEDLIWFLRNPMGRATLIVYNDFLSTLTGVSSVDFSQVIVDIPDRQSPPTSPPPTVSPDEHIFGNELEFPSNPACSEDGDVLILSRLVENNALRIMGCKNGSFRIIQAVDAVYPAYAAGLWPVLGEFSVRGTPLLALSHTIADDDVRFFPIKGNRFDFTDQVYRLHDMFGAYDKGAFVASGDFDGDGKDELLVSASQDRNEFSVYKMRGSEMELTQHEVSPVANYAAGLFPAAGDFDGDGVDELVLGHTVANDEFRVYRAINGRIDTNPIAIHIDIFPDAYTGGCFVAAGDLNGDGIDELIVSKMSENSDVQIYQYRNGAFQLLDAHYGIVPAYFAGITLATGDFDADGADELVIGHTVANDEARIYKFRNNKLDTEPMITIKNVFQSYAQGVLMTAGPMPAMWQR